MARDFTGGSTDKIDVGTFSVVSSAFTMCCWIYIDSFGAGDDRFISKADGTAAANHDWMLGKTSAGADKVLRCRFNRSSVTLAGGTNIPTGSWHHVLATYNNGTGTLYLNGTFEASRADFTTGNLPDNSDAVYIGNQPTSATVAPDGRIAEVAIWAAVLNANEITSLWRGTHPSRIRPESNVRGWMLDGNSSPEPEWTGLGVAGTLTGTAKANHAPVTARRIWMPSAQYFVPAVGGGAGLGFPFPSRHPMAHMLIR